MKGSTIGAVAMLALSTAALAQVAGAPLEQKTGGNTAANSAASNSAAPANDAVLPPASAPARGNTMGDDPTINTATPAMPDQTTGTKPHHR